MMLQVRFAEVNRRALTELGANFVVAIGRTSPAGRRRSSSPRRTSTTIRTGGLVFSDFLNLFFFNTRRASAPSSALQSKGFFQSLAEPNLIAYNGQEASFLAGGEIPVPIVQGAGATAP